MERTESGRRVYGEASLGCLLGVLCMKQAGMTLPQIKAFMDITIEGATTLPQRLEMMLNAREQLIKLKTAVDRGLQLADFFIEGCRNAMEALRIIEFPFQLTDEGKLEPDTPPADFALPKQNRPPRTIKPKKKI